MNAKEQYRKAYSLHRAYMRTAEGKSPAECALLARAFGALLREQGVGFAIDLAAMDSYSRRREPHVVPLAVRRWRLPLLREAGRHAA